MRKVVVDKDGKVVNAIEIEEGVEIPLPDGHSLLSETASKGADIGDSWNGASITKPVIIQEPTPPDLSIAITAAAMDVVTEIDKAFTARATKLSDTEKTNMRDKVVNLIAKAQGK